MTQFQKVSIFLLRITMGWLFFYAGITKVINPAWSAAGYLNGAKTFTGFYQWLANPDILPITNFLNEWGLTLIGLSLILGVFVRVSAVLGAAMMVLYYFPVLAFPKIGANAYLVDEHIIYTMALLVLASVQSGRIWGLETWCIKLPLCSRYPRLRGWLG